MCILIHHTEKTEFSKALLEDFYAHNSDGFGLMFGDGNKIHVTKSLGTVEETIAIYNDLAKGRDCIIHYRMKTHGKIDMNNCHPYRITDELWVAHNGILSASNPVDKDMSDTWHLIEYVLKPIAVNNMEQFFDPKFQEYLGAMIGSNNKLGFCHADGRSFIINEKSGVNYKNAWLSNTYAWSASKFGMYPKQASRSYFQNWEDEDYSFMYNSTTSTKNYGYVGNIKPKTYNYNKIIKAAYNSWTRGETHLIDWVVQAPEKAMYLLKEWYDYSDVELDQLVNAFPDEAAEYIAEIFITDSVQPSTFQ